MKIVRVVVSEAFLMYVLATFVAGLTIQGGVMTYLWAGCILALCGWIVRPVLHIITLPIALLSLGLSRALVNAVILLVLTKVIPAVSIHPFVFHQLDFYGFIIPTISFSYFTALLMVAILKSALQLFIQWIGET